MCIQAPQLLARLVSGVVRAACLRPKSLTGIMDGFSVLTAAGLPRHFERIVPIRGIKNGITRPLSADIYQANCGVGRDRHGGSGGLECEGHPAVRKPESAAPPWLYRRRRAGPGPFEICDRIAEGRPG